MQKPQEQRVPDLGDVLSRDGVREAVRRIHRFLIEFLRNQQDFGRNVANELTPLYGELDWTPVEIADGAQEVITIDVPDAILGYCAEVSYDQDLQELRMSYPHVVEDGVEVILKNDTGAPVTLDAGRFRAYVWARTLTA